MIRFFLSIVSVFGILSSISQTIIPRFESLSVNEGLPHSSVYTIYQDTKGYMWLGTADGLCRYDGTRLRSFKYEPVQGGEIVNNFIRGKISEDAHGNIWYSNETGIYKWDVLSERISCMRVLDKKRFADSEFRGLYIDASGLLWMLNIFKGIFSYDVQTGTLTNYPLPVKPDYGALISVFTNLDADGNIFFRINTGDDPYIAFDIKKRLYTLYDWPGAPHAVFFDHKSRVLAYEDKLVWQDSMASQQLVVNKKANNIPLSFYAVAGRMDNYDRLWMAVRGKGLCCYDKKSGSFHQYRHDNSKLKSLPFDLTTCLLIDREDNLWIGTDGGGVAKLDLKQPKFNLFPLSEGDYPVLSDYFTKCFYEDGNRRIWFGTNNDGLNIYDPATGSLLNYRHRSNDTRSIPGNIVASILQARDGNIWIGSSGGISLFEQEKGLFKTIPIPNLPALRPEVQKFVFKIIELSNGDLMAATQNGLIRVRKDNGRYTGHYFLPKRYLISSCIDVVEMSRDTIFAVIGTSGLYQLHPADNSFDSVHVSFKGIDLRSVQKDEKEDGYLWIGSSIGLIHFNTRNYEYRTWDERSGMANSYVYGCLQDDDGNLWMSTNKGISFFDRQENRFENYSYLDGLQSNEFNTHAFYKSASGAFYFGGIKGFNWFRPVIGNSEQHRPAAAVTRIEINDQVFQKDADYALNNMIRVPYYDNDFNFQFAALDYTRPEANKIRYMLQGWDTRWVVTDIKSIRYANLPPGEYTLRLSASNAGGIWSKEETVHLYIKAPYWQQAWFLILVAMLIIIAIVFFTYQISDARTKRKLQLLEKQVAINAERNRISADMHDEIGSGITHIALLSELIQAQQKPASEIKKDVGIISVSARKLVQTMSDIIWALNPQNDILGSLLAYIREQSQQYFEPLGIGIRFIFPEEIPAIHLTNEQRRNLYLVTKELLTNAVKHSGASMICLEVAVVQMQLNFTVTDNGTGMNEKEARIGSNGIRNMKKRMQTIGGNIRWLEVDKGVSVNYQLPV